MQITFTYFYTSASGNLFSLMQNIKTKEINGTDHEQ